MQRGRIRATEAIVVFAAAATYFGYFFQLWTSKAWTWGLGDWIDPYFGNVLLEHWYDSVLALHDPALPPMFHPAEAMRFSHGFVLFAPVYIAVRFFSHPFVANTLTLFLVLVGGAFSLHVLLRRLGLGAIEAFVVAAGFGTSANVVNGWIAPWAQRASVFFIPPILLLLVTAIRMPDGRARLAVGSLTGLLGVLLFSQDYYTAVLMLLVAGLVVLSLLPTKPGRETAVTHGRSAALMLARAVRPLAIAAKRIFPRRPGYAWLVVAGLAGAVAAAVAIHPIDRTSIGGWRFSVRGATRLTWLALVAGGWFVVRATLYWLAALALPSPTRDDPSQRGWRQLAMAAAGGGVLGAVIFLWLFRTALHEFQAFPRQQLFEALYQPNPAIWTSAGAVVRDVSATDTNRPFAIVLSLVLLMWGLRSAVPRWVRIQGAWFVAISLVVFVLPLRFGDWSPWAAVFGWMPGLSGVRDPKRIIYLYELGVALVAAMWIRQFRSASKPRIAAVSVVAAITAMSWNPWVIDYARDEHLFAQFVRAPIAIDPSCRSFFVKGASQSYMSRSGHMWSLYAVDAAFISLEHSIPTLNGYSAWAPDEWGLANPQNPDYRAAVDKWIALRGIQHTCELDIEARTMTPYNPRQ